MKASIGRWVAAVVVPLWLLGCGGKTGVFPDDLAEGQGGLGSDTTDGDRGGHSGGRQGDGGHAGGDGATGPAAHAVECEQICENASDAGCGADPTACWMLCATATGYDGCQSEISAWVDCATEAPIVCDPSGAPTFTGCDAQTMMLALCAQTQEPPKEVGDSCDKYCAEVDKAGCNFETELGSCPQLCGGMGMVASACQQAFVSLTKCQSRGTIICDASGIPTAAGCENEQLSYLGCVMRELGAGTGSAW